MKVLGVVSSLRMGGAERVMAWLLSGLATRGNQTALVTSESADGDFYDLDTAVRRRSLADEGNTGIPGLRRVLTQESPDVVISFLPRANVASILACRPLRIPIAVAERIDPRREDLPLATKGARRTLYPLANAIVVQSKELERWAKRAGPRSTVAVIPNPMVAPPGREFPWPRPKTVIAVGRLLDHKRVEWVIGGFAASPYKDEYQLRIVGDGPHRGYLEQRVRDYRIEERTTFVGAVADVWEELAQAQIYSLTSEVEGFPNALMEAMAAGCGSLSTDCPTGPADLIENGVNGILVPVDDQHTYRAALTDLMGDPQRCQQLGERAQQVTDTFAPHRILNQWEDLIRGMV